MALTTPRLNRYRHLPVMYLAEVTDRRGTLAEDLPHAGLPVRDGTRLTSWRHNRQRATPEPNPHKIKEYMWNENSIKWCKVLYLCVFIDVYKNIYFLRYQKHIYYCRFYYLASILIIAVYIKLSESRKISDSYNTDFIAKINIFFLFSKYDFRQISKLNLTKTCISPLTL